MTSQNKTPLPYQANSCRKYQKDSASASNSTATNLLQYKNLNRQMQTPSPAPHFIRMIIHESDQNNDSPRLQSREFFQDLPNENTNQSTDRYHKIDKKDMDPFVIRRIPKLRQDSILPFSIPEIRPQTNYHAKNNRSPFAKVSPKTSMYNKIRRCQKASQANGDKNRRAKD